MKTLFLDIDGVLNAHEPIDPLVLCGRIHPDKVARLNRILTATGARIVLSSAWRYIIHRGEATLAGMDWLLRSHGVLANRLVGITAPDTMIPASTPWDGNPASWPRPNERGHQIHEWLLMEPPEHRRPYLVLDDMDLGISAAGHPFLPIDGTVGLTDQDANDAIYFLNEVRRIEEMS